MKLMVKAILGFVMQLLSALLGPINALILSALPSLTGFNDMVVGFMEWLENFICWAFSWLPFTAGFYVMLVAYFTFRLTVPLLVHSIKLVVKWWHYLVP